MNESKHNYKLIGTFGLIFGLIGLVSFFIGDNSKLIIPVSNIFFVKYFIIICIINGSLYFIVAGILIYRGIYVPAYAETTVKLNKTKAKGFLLSLFFLSPSVVSLFTTIFTMAETMLWKILGSLAFIYISWLLYSNVRILIMSAEDQSGQP
jgi:hypothetical protein